MKKILLLLIAATISIGAVSAQKLTKAEKKAKKEAAFQEGIKRITFMFIAKELTFVPTELQTNTSGRTMINNYEYLKLNPEHLELDISYIAEDRVGAMRSGSTGSGDKGSVVKKLTNLRISTTAFQIVSNEPTKYGYKMVIKTDANLQRLELTLESSARTNITSLKIKSNRNSEVLYKGSIRQN